MFFIILLYDFFLIFKICDFIKLLTLLILPNQIFKVKRLLIIFDRFVSCKYNFKSGVFFWSATWLAENLTMYPWRITRNVTCLEEKSITTEGTRNKIFFAPTIEFVRVQMQLQTNGTKRMDLFIYWIWIRLGMLGLKLKKVRKGERKPPPISKKKLTTVLKQTWMKLQRSFR